MSFHCQSSWDREDKQAIRAPKKDVRDFTRLYVFGVQGILE